MKNTKKLVFTALLCSLTCIATMVIKIPTPTMGYIHPGDAVVLLCAFLLDPLPGALAAGIGSALSDLFSGYLSYIPATFMIKTVTALLAALIVSAARKKKRQREILAVVTGGIVGEAFMVTGYFVFEIFLMAFTAQSGINAATLAAGAASAISGVPFNIAQGIFGVIVAALLYPFLKKIRMEA